MFYLGNNCYLSCSDDSYRTEEEFGNLLLDIFSKQAHPIDNSSSNQIYQLEMKDDGGWLHDQVTEMYIDMSQNNSDKILRDAWEATNTFIEPKISFQEFSLSHRVTEI